ncbi:hypothetical protein GCM10027168_65970 [Streptomyces capparidis]
MSDQTLPLPSSAERPRAPRALGGSLPILAACVLWGTSGAVSSLAPSGASAAAVGAAGLALGGLLHLLASPAARRLPAACTGGERWLLLIGAVAVAGYPLCYYPAVARTGVAVATVLALGSAPVFSGLLEWAATGTRPTGRWTCATLAAVAGCALLVLGGGTSHIDVAGAGLAALGGLLYAVYSLVGGRLITRGHASGQVMAAMFGAAGLLVLPVALSAGTGWLLSLRGGAVAAHLAVFTTFLSYRLYGHGLRRTPASVATTLTLAEPAVAAVLGVAVLGERLPAASWCGLAVLAGGLAVLTAPRGRRGRRGRA